MPAQSLIVEDNTENPEANARLIQASPEMYTLLETLEYTEDETVGQFLAQMEQTLIKWRALKAKINSSENLHVQNP